jgi:hypothetical protein
MARDFGIILILKNFKINSTHLNSLFFFFLRKMDYVLSTPTTHAKFKPPSASTQAFVV